MALLCIAAFSISFDVQDIRLAVLDHDRTATSRDLVRHTSQGSRYFREMPPPQGDADAERGLRDGTRQLVLDIPPGFGRDLAAGRRPEVENCSSTAEAFPASNARAYGEAILTGYIAGACRDAGRADNRAAARDRAAFHLQSGIP
jgi:ribosome-dependent ATPase